MFYFKKELNCWYKNFIFFKSKYYNFKDFIIIFVILYKNKKLKFDIKLIYFFNLLEKNFKIFI